MPSLYALDGGIILPSYTLLILVLFFSCVHLSFMGQPCASFLIRLLFSLFIFKRTPNPQKNVITCDKVYRFKVGQHFLLERLSKESGGPALPGAAAAAGGGATAAAAALAGSEGANITSEALESAASLSGVVTDQLVKKILERRGSWFGPCIFNISRKRKGLK